MPSLTRIQKSKIQALAAERLRCPTEEAAQEGARTAFRELFSVYVTQQVSEAEALILDRYNARPGVDGVQFKVFGNEIVQDGHGRSRKIVRVSGIFLPLFPWIPPTRATDPESAEGRRAEVTRREEYAIKVPAFGWDGNGTAHWERIRYEATDLPGSVFHLNREAVPPEISQAGLDYYRGLIAHEYVRNERLSALRAGLERARTHKEAVALWPDAVEALPVSQKKAPLTDEDVAQIRAKVTGGAPA